MKSQQTRLASFRLALVVATVAAACVAGCETAAPAPRAVADADVVGSSDQEGELAVGGAEVWAKNCARCHNPRPLNSFSSTQWDLIAHHMRVRANLTAEEYRAVRSYLTGTHR